MLVWQSRRRGVHYEVRRAGRSLRLYRDGVFHSQYNDARLLNGGVWDMLWLPMFFLGPRDSYSGRDVLVLGVGGGAAINKIAHQVSPKSLTGIDIDEVHLRIARRLFRVPGQVELYCEDASAWLRQTRRYFDVIIDDIFQDISLQGDRGGRKEAVRQPPGSYTVEQWLQLQLTHLATDGMLLVNTDCGATARELVDIARAFDHPALKNHCVLSRTAFHNRVVVFSAMQPERSLLKRHLQASGMNAGEVKQAMTSFRMHRLAQ